MFDTIKDVLKTREDLHRIDAQVKVLIETMNTHTSAVLGLSNSLNGFTSQLVRAHEVNATALEKISADHKALSLLRKDMEGEMNALRVVRSKIEESMSVALSKHMEQAISPHIERLKTDVKQYNELKGTFSTLSLKISEVYQEVERLKSATQRIKDSDGTYVQMAKELLSSDQHKLELMRKIEVLERLISKERRSRNEPRR